MSCVPIIDFSKFLDPNSTDEDRLTCAKELDRACREVGFFYITGHGIPAELLTTMLDTTRAFFETATEDEKESIKTKKAGDGIGDDARGFQRVNGGSKGSHEVRFIDTVTDMTVPSPNKSLIMLQCIDFYRPVENQGPPYTTGMGVNQWPKSPAILKPVAEVYIDHTVKLGVAITKAMALGLGVDERIFTSRVDKAFWNLRLLAYEGKEPKVDKEKVAGIGQHTDFGILTMLLTDPQKNSLQVLSKSGDWVPADPIPGCLTCNIGDMLSKWTDGLYKSTLHRVIHNSPNMRISIPMFFDPNFDALISPVLPLNRPESAEEGILYKDAFIRATLNSIVV
ncbi:putativeoxoglutarate 3-dioxygenase [Phaeomoniella chlamydospora]|uniref:Putativeoxoglutarate 3-dioxygenase n=1 Tax=Phaeomoniella chlamydospora TaxID=158046 RepID=A0A0G2DZM0_PHACM|nr:putativeoxoglutarate 3-dioxygenase [Phaeomoniella chlamydospora]